MKISRRLPDKMAGKLSEKLAQMQSGLQSGQNSERATELKQNVDTALHHAAIALGPLYAAARRSVQRFLAARGSTTLGSTFRHLCVVGLNRTELLFSGESQPVFGDTWQELVDESMRRGLGLIFFAPRSYDGSPVNPYLFLAGEQIGLSADDAVDSNTLALAQQLVGTLPLLDFCRISPAAPNTINILAAADTLFHWDVKDNYVLPTTPVSWARDVEQVLKGYPRTTRANIYTQWDTDLLPQSDRITLHGLRDLPLDASTWINKPTVQEAYGNHILALGLVLAGLVGGYLYWNQRGLDDLNEQLRVVEQQIPSEGRFGDLERAVREQEQMMQRRELFYLATKDAARSLQLSGFKAANFEVRTPDSQSVPNQLLVTVEAAKDAYNGWLQEEPVARAFMANSAMLQAIRKPPANTYKLEGLVDLISAGKAYTQLANATAAGKTAASSDKTGAGSAKGATGGLLGSSATGSSATAKAKAARSLAQGDDPDAPTRPASRTDSRGQRGTSPEPVEDEEEL